jgi:RimK-like ATP-grasp domain
VILVWGLPSDGPIELVRAALAGAREEVLFLDQRRVLDAELEVIFDGGAQGTLRTDGRSVALDDFEAVYLRLYDFRALPRIAAAGASSDEWARALAFESALTAWAELTRARVVNRPSDMGSNGAKCYQAAIIERHGFATPPTLVTTSPDAAREFWARHGTVVYKSLSSVRSLVRRLGDEHHDRLGDVAWCPTQFQAWVPGVDYRVHVVGGDVFPCRVTSSADDYRYAAREGATTEVAACELPDEIAARCLGLAGALGLHFAGVDLRRTPDGEWVCFEVNPSPAFSYYQSRTGQPIADAVARLLASSRRPIQERS